MRQCKRHPIAITVHSTLDKELRIQIRSRYIDRITYYVTPNQAVQLTKSPRECINIILCSKYEHEKESTNDTSDTPSITEEDIEKLDVDNNRR